MNGEVIVLEFNELTPALVERFCKAGQLPGFSRLFAESSTYVTDAEEAAPNLEPWIQWVTVHTGLSFQEHGVFELGVGHKLTHPRLWDLASDAGRRVWVCGSMNAGHLGELNGYVLPDPWSGSQPYPAGEFDDYFGFVSRYVQEYTRDRVPVSKADHLRFLRFMVRRGLSARTMSDVIRQLSSERGGHNRWKRATILDRLQWDLFRWYYKNHRPQYATFFLNSTAHYQHFYWRNLEPGAFTRQPTEQEQAEYSDAVLYGYQQMDRIIQECMALAGPQTTIVLCTALSQQPCLVYEDSGGKKIHRATDPERLLKFAGITDSVRIAPVMAEQFRIYFADEDAAKAAQKKLAALTVGGKKAMGAQQEGCEVFTGCWIFSEVPADTILTSEFTGQSARFQDYFYLVDGTKSGMHHPDGILWVRTPERRHAEHGRVSLRQVAPTILSLLGIPEPSFMREPLPEVASSAIATNPR